MQTDDRRDRVVEIFEDAKFKLHKWNSNARELEFNSEPAMGNDEVTCDKQQLSGDINAC